MRSLVGVGKPEEFLAALLEAQSLRLECAVIKAEVERHQTEHGDL
jgi:hypothetical protein